MNLMLPFPYSTFRSARGFSTVEAVLVISMIGILSGVGFVTYHNVNRSVSETKLRSDVVEINKAIALYQTRGGSVPNGDANSILTALKSVADTGRNTAGYGGALIDPRLEAVFQSSNEAQSDAERAVWNAAENRFIVSEGGLGGVKEFRLNDQLATMALPEESRDQVFAYSPTSDWLWDYDGTPPVVTAQPTQIVVDEASVGTSPDSNTSLSQLPPPIFSIASGTYSYDQLTGTPLQLSLPAGVPSEAIIRYSLNSSGWQDYSGDIAVGPADTQVSAYVVMPGSSEYLQSGVSTNVYILGDFALSGDSEGDFANPAGGNTLVSVLDTLDDRTYFEWGTPTEGYTTGSSLTFRGSRFDEVRIGERFQLGSLEYFNGTILSQTGAETVDLAIDFSLDSPSLSETFDFQFELINSPNVEGDLDGSADFVRFTSLTDTFDAEIYGRQYALSLSFGYDGTDGFSTVDSFFVHEGASATADIFGIFEEIED